MTLNRTFLEVTNMVVTWWIVAFCPVNAHQRYSIILVSHQALVIYTQ